MNKNLREFMDTEVTSVEELEKAVDKYQQGLCYDRTLPEFLADETHANECEELRIAGILLEHHDPDCAGCDYCSDAVDTEFKPKPYEPAAFTESLEEIRGQANKKIRDMREEIEQLRGYIKELQEQPKFELGPYGEIEHETTHCLHRAASLVTGDRAEAYGPPSHSFACVAKAWQAYLTAAVVGREDPDLDGRDVANMMIGYKTIRDSVKRKPYNQDDIAGYAQVASWIGDPRVQR